MGLFARSGEPVVQRAAPALLEAASQLQPDLLAVHVHDGIGVAEYEVYRRDDDSRATPPTSDPIVLLSIRTGCRPADLAQYIYSGSPAEVVQCDTHVELILSGPFADADWAIVRAICRAATDLWGALLWDEMDGFAATVE